MIYKITFRKSVPSEKGENNKLCMVLYLYNTEFISFGDP